MVTAAQSRGGGVCGVGSGHCGGGGDRGGVYRGVAPQVETESTV